VDLFGGSSNGYIGEVIIAYSKSGELDIVDAKRR